MLKPRVITPGLKTRGYSRMCNSVGYSQMYNSVVYSGMCRTAHILDLQPVYRDVHDFITPVGFPGCYFLQFWNNDGFTTFEQEVQHQAALLHGSGDC